jgi:hypothetical protein
MFSIQKSILFFALVAVSLGHMAGYRRRMNVTDACRKAMKLVQKPNTTECSLPNRKPASKDKFCPNAVKCLDWAKKHLQQECQSNLENRMVKFSIEYGLNITYTNMCIKDSKNEYCSIRRHQTDKSKCDECLPKFVETVNNVMKDAPVEQREKTLKRFSKRRACNKQQPDTVQKIKTNDGALAPLQTFVSYTATVITLGYAVLM